MEYKSMALKYHIWLSFGAWGCHASAQLHAAVPSIRHLLFGL